MTRRLLIAIAQPSHVPRGPPPPPHPGLLISKPFLNFCATFGGSTEIEFRKIFIMGKYFGDQAQRAGLGSAAPAQAAIKELVWICIGMSWPNGQGVGLEIV